MEPRALAAVCRERASVRAVDLGRDGLADDYGNWTHYGLAAANAARPDVRSKNVADGRSACSDAGLPDSDPLQPQALGSRRRGLDGGFGWRRDPDALGCRD